MIRLWLLLASVLLLQVEGAPQNVLNLDLKELEKLGISVDDLVQHLRRLAQGNYVCGYREISDMRRHFLRNRTVTCNDGSPAG